MKRFGQHYTLSVKLKQSVKLLSVELHNVECKTTHTMYHYIYIYPSDVKLHAKGEIKHQVYNKTLITVQNCTLSVK